LKTARQHAFTGRYEDALAVLEKIPSGRNSRPEIEQEIAFYKAYCQSQLALQSQSDGDGIRDAAARMRDFLNKNKDSCHWYPGNELFGDLAVANGSLPAAEKAYGELAKAPWAEYKMRAQVALGRVYLAQDKTDEAAKAFDAALAQNDGSDAAKLHKQAAAIGKARILVVQKKPDEAIRQLQPIIAQLEPEAADSAQLDLLSYAYSALGYAKRTAGRSKDALYDFLRVHVMYGQVPDAHAESLYNLGQLWDEFHEADRALKARLLLQQQYKNSPWANKKG
jgi:tetratricopeptide (TPR) repeat protein